MAYVVSYLWSWVLSAFVIGIATAILVRQPEEKRWIARWTIWACLALLAAAAVARVDALVGRPGLYVESGVASFVAFILGGVVGTRFTAGSLREHKGWALGLGPAALTWLGACLFATPGLEADLKARAGQAIESAGGDPLKIEIAGRDVILPSDVADRDKLIDKLLDVNGVRLVAAKLGAITEPPARVAASASAPATGEIEGAATAVDKAPTEKAPAAQALKEKATEPSPVAAEVGRPLAVEAPPAAEIAAPTNAALPTRESAVQQAATETPEQSRSTGAAPADNNATAAAVLAGLRAAGELDAATCQAVLSATATLEKIEFGNASAKIRFVTAPVLDKIAALLKRCPGVKVEIGVHTDAAGAANQRLSQDRADKLISYLEREGVARGMLSGVGYGGSKPIASNATDESRARNRRVEFIVK
jgi:outer membrane protein OmpA-like peptidoglycan-associated protein